jgi:hypothetical protein
MKKEGRIQIPPTKSIREISRKNDTIHGNGVNELQVVS